MFYQDNTLIKRHANIDNHMSNLMWSSNMFLKVCQMASECEVMMRFIPIYLSCHHVKSKRCFMQWYINKKSDYMFWVCRGFHDIYVYNQMARHFFFKCIRHMPIHVVVTVCKQIIWYSSVQSRRISRQWEQKLLLPYLMHIIMVAF